MTRRLLLPLLFLAACGPAKEKEPNNHFTQATPVKAKGSIRGSIASADDIDVFRLEIKDDSSLSFHLPGIRDVDFVVSLQDKDRQELKRYDETAAGGDERGLDLGLAPGQYYLQVSNKNNAANNPEQAYQLTLSRDPAQGREREPNDKPAFASPLTPGELARGHYFPSRNLLAPPEEPAEEDWFVLSIATGVFRLNLDLSEVPRVDPVLEIHDANGYKLKEVDGGGPGAAESLRDFGIKGPAQYFLRLRSKGLAGNSEIGYELLTELLPYEGRNEFEPNEQRPDATPFAGESIAGRVASPGDVDWYRLALSTETRQLLRVELSGIPGLDLVLGVADDLGNTLMTIDNLGRDQPEVLTGLGARQGELHLIVSEKSGKADARRPYTLSRSLHPHQAGLEFELNDSSASAQAIKVGESVDAYLAPKGDADWYEFNVYQAGQASADLTGLLNVALSASLYDQEGRLLESKTAPKGQPLSLAKPLEAGTYWLRVSAGEDQSNVRDKYTLRVGVR